MASAAEAQPPAPPSAPGQGPRGRWGLWLILGLGFLLRLAAYLVPHSMWLDELFLTVNFQDSGLGDLLRGPLEYGHLLPGGFLAMTWLSVQLFGYHDEAFKLFPFLCGVASLPLFYAVARVYLHQRAVPWAVILFSFSAPLIAYSGEFKQYSTDVVVCLALLLITARVEAHEGELPWLAYYAVAGALAVWFSLPAVFVLAGVGSYVVLAQIQKGRLDRAGWLTLVCLVWIANWLFVFFVVMGGGPSDAPPGPWVLEFWRRHGGFMPSPFTIAGLAWLLQSGLDLFSEVAGLQLPWLAAVLCLLGCVAAPNRTRTLLVFCSPVLLCAGASYFERYPFSGRVILFLVPALMMMVASGINRLPGGSKSAGLALRILLVGVLVWIPNPGRWQTRQEIKSCLRVVQEGWRPGDRIYVYHWTEPAYRHYAAQSKLPADANLITPVPRYPFVKEIDARRSAQRLRAVPVEEATVIWGVSEHVNYGRVDLDKLDGRGRVWFLFTHCPGYGPWTDYLDKLGDQREAQEFPGAAVFLYDL